MKPLMRNTLFGASLLLSALAGAQQAATTINSVHPVETLAPVVAQGATISQNGYYFSDHQIKDEDLKSKEVSKEISVPKGADIYIENAGRSVVVKTWDQPKVKVTTTVYFEKESKLTDEEWLERVGLSLKTLGNSVKIKSGSTGSNGVYTLMPGNGYSYSNGLGSTMVFNSSGQGIGSKANVKRVTTITVPAGSKLDIESKYADVQLPAGVGDVNVDISNGNLEAENLNKLVLRSKYSNANIGDVKTAELEFSNGRFSAKNIDDLDIDSKYSTIEMATARKLVLRSTNDEYEIEDAGEVRGRKNYGNLRITKLNNSIELDGANADVKIRNVGSALTLIKLDDRYADVRIPLRGVKDYAIDFSGVYSSVYGNFEKVPVTTAEKKEEKTGSTNIAPSASASGFYTPAAGQQATTLITGTRGYTWGGDTGPARFTATVGSGKGLKVEMKCQNCTVDFK